MRAGALHWLAQMGGPTQAILPRAMVAAMARRRPRRWRPRRRRPCVRESLCFPAPAHDAMPPLHTAPGHYSHCHCSFLSPAAGRWRNRRCRCELLLLLLLAVATEEEVDSCALAAPLMHPSAAPDSDFMILHSHDPMFDWQAMVLLAAWGRGTSIHQANERGERRQRAKAASTALS